jgi:hypothetical protein
LDWVYLILAYKLSVVRADCHLAVFLSQRMNRRWLSLSLLLLVAALVLVRLLLTALSLMNGPAVTARIVLLYRVALVLVGMFRAQNAPNPALAYCYTPKRKLPRWVVSFRSLNTSSQMTMKRKLPRRVVSLCVLLYRVALVLVGMLRAQNAPNPALAYCYTPKRKLPRWVVSFRNLNTSSQMTMMRKLPRRVVSLRVLCARNLKMSLRVLCARILKLSPLATAVSPFRVTLILS